MRNQLIARMLVNNNDENQIGVDTWSCNEFTETSENRIQRSITKEVEFLLNTPRHTEESSKRMYSISYAWK